MYHMRDGDNEVVGTSGADDGLDNNINVRRLVHVVGAFVQEFLYDVRKVFRQRLPDLRARILARHVTAYTYKLVYGDMVPVVKVCLVSLYKLELFLGVIDESAEFFLLRLAQLVAEDVVHLSLDITGRVPKHMLERLVLAVQISKEMFGTLG